MNFRLSLVDNDYVVRAKTDLTLEGEEAKFGKFLRTLNEELVAGNTAFLEIEGSRFEISKAE
jgi:hypothetical protein